MCPSVCLKAFEWTTFLGLLLRLEGVRDCLLFKMWGLFYCTFVIVAFSKFKHNCTALFVEFQFSSKDAILLVTVAPNAKIQVQSSPHFFNVQHKHTNANEISYSVQKDLSRSFDARKNARQPF